MLLKKRLNHFGLIPKFCCFFDWKASLSFLGRFWKNIWKTDISPKVRKSEIGQIWILWSNAFHGPPKFTEASDWLKNGFNLFRMVNGEFTRIWLTFECVIWPNRDVSWFAVVSNPPQPLMSRKKLKFLGLITNSVVLVIDSVVNSCTQICRIVCNVCHQTPSQHFHIFLVRGW